MPSRQRCAALLAGLVGAAGASAGPGAEMELQSCVDGSPSLRVPVTTEHAVLDPHDRNRFQEAAQSQYPLYQRGGTVASQVLLLRRGGHWQYVTLWHGGPSGLCFSAVFAADRFDFTPGWVAKYRPRAAEAAD